LNIGFIVGGSEGNRHKIRPSVPFYRTYPGSSYYRPDLQTGRPSSDYSSCIIYRLNLLSLECLLHFLLAIIFISVKKMLRTTHPVDWGKIETRGRVPTLPVSLWGVLPFNFNPHSSVIIPTFTLLLSPGY
jgi:hypothetical protein